MIYRLLIRSVMSVCSSDNKEYLSALPNDLSRRMVSLRASWNVGDTQRSMKPSIRESLHWDADAPPLPAKETVEAVPEALAPNLADDCSTR